MHTRTSASTRRLEFHSLARDRQWFLLAVNEVAPRWHTTSRSMRALEGVAGRAARGAGRQLADRRLPARQGRVRRTDARERSQRGPLRLAIEGYADGPCSRGRGVATRDTGYERRGSVDIDGIALRQVMAGDARGESACMRRQHFADSRRVGGR